MTVSTSMGRPGYWGYCTLSIDLRDLHEICIEPINFSDQTLLLNQLYPGLPDDAGADVVVGVIDTGITGAHPALSNVTGGVNMVTDETANSPGADADWGPAKVDGEHGTHVAGIIGMRPLSKAPIRGVAPGVRLRSYRVFPHSGEGASNYDVMAAIDRAVTDTVIHRHLHDRITLLDHYRRRLSGFYCRIGTFRLPIHLEQIPAALWPLAL